MYVHHTTYVYTQCVVARAIVVVGIKGLLAFHSNMICGWPCQMASSASLYVNWANVHTYLSFLKMQRCMYIANHMWRTVYVWWISNFTLRVFSVWLGCCIMNWETPLAKRWMMSLPQLFDNPESWLVRKIFITDGRNKDWVKMSELLTPTVVQQLLRVGFPNSRNWSCVSWIQSEWVFPHTMQLFSALPLLTCALSKYGHAGMSLCEPMQACRLPSVNLL